MIKLKKYLKILKLTWNILGAPTIETKAEESVEAIIPIVTNGPKAEPNSTIYYKKIKKKLSKLKKTWK